MTREIIINELNNRGYKAEAHNTIKNGVELEGIRIMTASNIAPVIYTDSIIRSAEEENKSLDDVVAAIINIYESHNTINIDVNRLFERDFILNSIYIGLQKTSTEDIEKKDCDLDGIEEYLYIRGESDSDGRYSIKATEAILECANISEVEAWEQAEANTNAETKIQNMAEIMAEFMGDEYAEEMSDENFMFVISNKSRFRGASGILNKKVLENFGAKYHTNKIVVIPSSIHEMIIVPYTEKVSLDEFSEMVGEVNNTQVDPTERLTDKAYIVSI